MKKTLQFKKFLLALGFVAVLTPAAAKADFIDYMSGCLMGMGSGLGGAAIASTKLMDGQKMKTSGYAIAGGFGCLVGVGYVAIVGATTEFDATYQLKVENEFLTMKRDRMARQLCLMDGSCEDTDVIVVKSGTELKKMGDAVYKTQTYRLQPYGK